MGKRTSKASKWGKSDIIAACKEIGANFNPVRQQLRTADNGAHMMAFVVIERSGRKLAFHTLAEVTKWAMDPQRHREGVRKAITKAAIKATITNALLPKPLHRPIDDTVEQHYGKSLVAGIIEDGTLDTIKATDEYIAKSFVPPGGQDVTQEI